MKIPHAILKSASTDDTREVLKGAFIDSEHGQLVVTNGMVMAVHPFPEAKGLAKSGYLTSTDITLANGKKRKDLDLFVKDGELIL